MPFLGSKDISKTYHKWSKNVDLITHWCYNHWYEKFTKIAKKCELS